MKKTMIFIKFVVFILLIVSNIVVETVLVLDEYQQDFLMNSDDKILVKDIPSCYRDFGSSRSISTRDLNSNLLKFVPKYLDFKQRPLGVPHLQKVTLFNVDSNKSVDMTSVSGSTVHFHSSFFENKRIPPLGNTTFNVVFLGREEGSIKSNLFIHTTEGHFKYQVKGVSVSSPYRLRPIVGIKLPLNTTFSSLIYIYNPYMEPIQVLEIYSSGGDFHLELPNGELEGPKNVWEISSQETKAIIRVRFHSKTEQNHTAYVRIKLNNTEELLVVPLEIEVTPNAGLYSPQGFVDFGVGGSLDSPKPVELYVINPLRKTVKISSVTTTSKAIKIRFENIKIDSNWKNPKAMESASKIATLTVDWKTAYRTKEFSGKIIVKYKNGKERTEIPYYLTVFDGGLIFNSSATTYFINEFPKDISRNVTVKNGFLSTLAILKVFLPVDIQKYFEIVKFKPIILKSQEEKSVCILNLKAYVAGANFKLNSHILLETNISTVQLPLLSYNGKLQVIFPYVNKENFLDLGLVSLDSKKSAYFLLLNSNPIGINFRQMMTSLPASSVELIGCGKGNHSTALLLDFTKNLTKCMKLVSGDFAIFGLNIHSPQAYGQVWGEAVIETQFEKLVVPVHYRAAHGKLEIGPDRLVFDQCFPKKICSHPLRVHSTFSHPMVIENILSIPPDPRLTSKHLGHIIARSTKIVGYLYLDPSIGCGSKCYLGLNVNDTVHWLQTFALPTNTSEIDLNLTNILYERYLNETENETKKWRNITMRLDTSEVKWHLFKTRVKMSWPSLLVHETNANNTKIRFKLTQIGNVSYTNITIRNPSSHDLLVQLVLNPSYPEFETLNNGLSPNFIPGHSKYEFLSPSGTFFLKNDCGKRRKDFKEKLNVHVHDETLPLFLSPGQNFTVRIGFKPEDAISSSIFLYVRNNLTVVEVIQLKGVGAFPSFRFGNRKPGSIQPLAFELTEKHLKDCEHRKERFLNLTVKRTFTARNMGDVPIFVNQFFINGLPCEGYGFKVLNCNSFALKPNNTRKIDIAFTPDFTLSKIVRSLTLDTSLNVPINYTLIAVISPNYLLQCGSALSRPLWEPYLYYVLLFSMCVLLLFVVTMIIIEADHILKETVIFVHRTKSTREETLDLRLVGAQIRNEMRSQKGPDIFLKDKIDQAKNDALLVTTAKDDFVKSENEKYTAIIPAVSGKSKKRLSNKLDNEIQKSVNNKKHSLIQKSKTRAAECDTRKKNQETKEKHVNRPKQKLNKNEAVGEEETSSTTTESSNNEEIEKEHDKIKREPDKTSFLTTSNLRTYTGKVEQFKCLPSKVETKKGCRRAAQKNNGKDIQEQKDNSKSPTEFSGRSKGVKVATKLHKEKQQQPLNRKTFVEKKLNGQIENNSTTACCSPTLHFNNIWSDSRATFSDVVARTDNALALVSSRPVLTQPQNQNCKPTMYVEPYKQTTTDLGPIGSRKTNHQLETRQDQSNGLSNSFFSDSSNLTFTNSTSLFNLDENWEQETVNTASQLFDFAQSSTTCSEILDTTSDLWNCQSGDASGFWNANDTQNNLLNESLVSSNEHEGGNTYLWGSSSVWQPWDPLEIPRSPTRTPPGFTSNHEIEQHMQHNAAYDLFGMTNIWAQQYPNLWNYPQGH